VSTNQSETPGLPVWAQGIEGQVALVTGAGRGLGRACALALSRAGARVIAVARTRAELERLAAEAPNAVEAWVEDLREDAVLARIERLARLDILVNNAGTNQPQAFLEVTDVALDTMPYNGTTTTCEALWMGTPVVALRGDRHAARVGASLLAHAGLPELVAEDPDAYVDLAVDLAGDRTRRERYHAGLRATLAGSVLCDATRHARRIEALFLGLWRERASDPENG